MIIDVDEHLYLGVLLVELLFAFVVSGQCVQLVVRGEVLLVEDVQLWQAYQHLHAVVIYLCHRVVYVVSIHKRLNTRS